jgi:hypothetical protein
MQIVDERHDGRDRHIEPRRFRAQGGVRNVLFPAQQRERPMRGQIWPSPNPSNRNRMSSIFLFTNTIKYTFY